MRYLSFVFEDLLNLEIVYRTLPAFVVDSSGGLTFQLVSCEEMGILKFWVKAYVKH